MVVYEVVLSVQRLITKYGPKLHIEWDILLHILKDLRPWAINVSPVVIAINGKFSVGGGSLERLNIQFGCLNI